MPVVENVRFVICKIVRVKFMHFFELSIISTRSMYVAVYNRQSTIELIGFIGDVDARLALKPALDHRIWFRR